MVGPISPRSLAIHGGAAGKATNVTQPSSVSSASAAAKRRKRQRSRTHSQAASSGVTKKCET